MSWKLAAPCAVASLLLAADVEAATINGVTQTAKPVITNTTGMSGQAVKLASTGKTAVVDGKGTPDTADDTAGALLNTLDALTMQIDYKGRVTLADVGQNSEESIHVTLFGSGEPKELSIAVSLPTGTVTFPLTKGFGKANISYVELAKPTLNLDNVSFTLTNKGANSIFVTHVDIGLDADGAAAVPLPYAAGLLASALGLLGLAAVARRRFA